jgi:alpha-D-ribose 1-methylphosphonate 5-triphosphate synthase subunit PhnG
MTASDATTREGTPAAAQIGVVDSLDEPTAGRIAAVLGMERFEVVAGPRTELVMMTVTDPFDTDFHLGEVLVTQAVVQAGGVRGWGMSVGEVPQRALLKAILDSLARAGDVPALRRAAALLAPEQARVEAERRREAELVARTRVQFDLMPGA